MLTSSPGSTQSAGYGVGLDCMLVLFQLMKLWPNCSFGQHFSSISIFIFSHFVAFQNPQETSFQGTILVKVPKGGERSLSLGEDTSEVPKAWKWSLTFHWLICCDPGRSLKHPPCFLLSNGDTGFLEHSFNAWHPLSYLVPWAALWGGFYCHLHLQIWKWKLWEVKWFA